MLNWKIFKRQPETKDCVQAQDFLTGAFDGEASDPQISWAQEHRARCASCQSLWSEWETTRALLRAVPTPLVPAPLCEQILLACRALPNAELAIENEPSAAAMRADLIAYLEAPNEDFSVARLAPLAVAATPPPTLARQILERTTPTKTRSRRVLWPTARAFFQAGSTPTARPLRAARWGFGLAAPALAAWLIFVSQTSMIQTPLLQTPPQKTPPKQSLRVFPNVPNSKSNLKNAAPEPAQPTKFLPGIQKSSPRIAALPGSTKAQSTRLSAAASTVEMPTEAKLKTVSPRRFAVSFKPLESARKNSPTQKTRAKKTLQSPPRAVPLLDKTISAQPKFARVALKTSASKLPFKSTHSFGQGVEQRISSPALASAGTTAPRFADARFVDTDFDEALSNIARQRDNRPEDLGRALDEYSSSLLSEESAENDDEEWG